MERYGDLSPNLKTLTPLSLYTETLIGLGLYYDSTVALEQRSILKVRYVQHKPRPLRNVEFAVFHPFVT